MLKDLRKLEDRHGHDTVASRHRRGTRPEVQTLCAGDDRTKEATHAKDPDGSQSESLSLARRGESVGSDEIAPYETSDRLNDQ